MSSTPARSRAISLVRRAKAGESLLALDGRSYALDENAVVISDHNGVESLAGIMGGEASGCGDGTTDVLIESALVGPQQYRPTPAESSASSRTRAIASSAASIPPSSCPALKSWRPSLSLNL